MAVMGCPICDAAHGDVVGTLSAKTVADHQLDHQPTNAGYNPITGKVVRDIPFGAGVPEASPIPATHEAYDLVMRGARQTDYGHPNQDFAATGRIGGAILTNWLRSEGYSLTAPDGTEDVDVPDIDPRIVALMLTGVKLSREAYSHKHDNCVDGIGYWLCADRIAEPERYGE